jgi:hypothetical protein
VNVKLPLELGVHRIERRLDVVGVQDLVQYCKLGIVIGLEK